MSELNYLQSELDAAELECSIVRRVNPAETISAHLRSLLAGLCVSHGDPVPGREGRAYEISIPDRMYGMLSTGGLLKWRREGDKLIVRYEPAGVAGRTVQNREIRMLEDAS